MPNYVTKALNKFQHPTPKRTQYAPHQWTCPNYGATKQLATPLDTSLPIPEERNHRIQQIIVTLLYYSRSMEFTILPSPNTLADQQSSPTKNTESAITHFLNYAATEGSAGINAKLYDRITPQISTSHPKARPICTPSMCAPKLWSNKKNSQLPWILHRQS